MATKRTPRKGTPGTFSYWGGCVHECDNDGVFRPRRDIGPGYVGAFRYKYFSERKSKKGTK